MVKSARGADGEIHSRIPLRFFSFFFSFSPPIFFFHPSFTRRHYEVMKKVFANLFSCYSTKPGKLWLGGIALTLFFSFFKVPLLLYASWRFGDSCMFFFSIPFLFFSDESFVFLAYKWMFACIYIVKGFEEIFKSWDSWIYSGWGIVNAALSVCLFSCKYCDICISGF